MRFLLVVFLLCSSVAAWAQAPTPSPAPSPEANSDAKLEVSTSYTKLANGANAGANATVVSARLPVTGRWSVVYQQWQIPVAQAQIFLGEAEYREPLSHVLRCGSCSGAKFDLSKIDIYVRAGAGSRRDSVGDNARAAYGLFGGIAVPAGKLAGASLAFSVDVGFIGSAKLKQPSQRTFFLNNAPTIAPGVVLRW